MSKERYYAEGAEKNFKSTMPRLRDRIEKHERNEQDEQIREAKRIGGSQFLRDSEAQ